MDLLTMSLSAAVMIAAIVILRALLIDRLPKTTFLILWAVVLLRLLVPVSVPSAWSVYSLLQPKQQSIQTVQEESTVLPQVEPGGFTAFGHHNGTCNPCGGFGCR